MLIGCCLVVGWWWVLVGLGVSGDHTLSGSRSAPVVGGGCGLRAGAVRLGGGGACGGLFVNCIVVVSIFLFCGFCLVLVGIRWMPWHQELMKDVAACDMPRGVGERVLIRGFPNGGT